jgi:hypothetical protein
MAAIALESASISLLSARRTRRLRSSGWFWDSFHLPSSRVISMRKPTIAPSSFSTFGADSSKVQGSGLGLS